MALSDGLVGYWSPWLGSSGYRLLDRTSYANHGVLTNMDAGTDWVGATVIGRSGFAMDFDGTNDYVSLAITTMMATAINNKRASLCCWFKTSSNNSTKFPFSLGSTVSDSPIFGFRFQSTGAIEGFFRDNAGNVVLPQGSTVLSDNKWHLACVTVDGSSMRVFVDGALHAGPASISTIGTTTINTGAIGALRRTGLAAYFSGQEAECSLFARSIAASEAQQLFTLGPGWYRPYAKRAYGYAIAGFKAYWARRQSQLIGGGV